MLNHAKTKAGPGPEIDHPPMCGREIATHAPCPNHPRTGSAAFSKAYEAGQRSILQAVNGLYSSPMPAALVTCQTCRKPLEIGQAVHQAGHDAHRNVLWAHEDCPLTPEEQAERTAFVQAVQAKLQEREREQEAAGANAGPDQDGSLLETKYPNLTKESTK